LVVPALVATVFPFILWDAAVLGIDSGYLAIAKRHRVWESASQPPAEGKSLRTWPRPVHDAAHDVTALPVDVYALAAPPCGGWGLRSRAVDKT
jgi:hypothetical protein